LIIVGGITGLAAVILLGGLMFRASVPVVQFNSSSPITVPNNTVQYQFQPQVQMPTQPAMPEVPAMPLAPSYRAIPPEWRFPSPYLPQNGTIYQINPSDIGHGGETGHIHDHGR
jgi:hypothetical protein